MPKAGDEDPRVRGVERFPGGHKGRALKEAEREEERPWEPILVTIPPG